MKGNLSRGVLPGLLRELFVDHKTGLLHVTRDFERRSVRFQDGRIVGAQASDPEDQMGAVLVRQGFLSPADLDRASEVVVREHKRLGRALRDLGVWDAAKAEEALALQAREILLKLFSWKEGSYVFEEQEGPDGAEEGDTTPKLSTGQLILDAARRVEDYPVVHEALGDLDRVLILSKDALLRFQNIMLTPADGYVLSRVDGEMTAREVLQVTPFAPEEAEKSLYCLLCTGALEYGGAHVAPPPRPAPRPRPEASPAAPPPRTDARPTQPTAVPPPTPGADEAARRGLSARRREVLDKFAGLGSKNHFEVLEISPDASADKVKEAYFRLAKRYHPDSHHREAVLEDVKDKLETVFIRLGEAYDVLRNPRTRATYELGRKTRGTAVAPAVAPPVAAPGPVFTDPAALSQRDTDALRKAEKLAEREQYWDVIQLLEGVVPRLAGKQKQRGRMALGRAYLKNPNWVKEGEELVRAVIAEDPRHAAAHLLLGQVYKERGLKARALSMLRKAVELEPDNEQANAELASLATEAPAPPAPEGRGLIKKLFGRS
jgi:tetratricopeptide (TPR) repeat protein